MFLSQQKKLTRAEWEHIERPIYENEKEILKLIEKGMDDPHTYLNKNKAIISILKIDKNPEVEIELYNFYFKSAINKLVEKIPDLIKKIPNPKSKKALTKKDLIRIENTKKNLLNIESRAFEYIMLETASILLTADQYKGYYTLHYFRNNPNIHIENINPYVIEFIDTLLKYKKDSNAINNKTLFYKTPDIIQKNAELLKYSDITLYQHQKDLFNAFSTAPQARGSKLVFYKAPTGGGKTLSPIGLSVKYKIIFLCISRNVCLALSKSAISIGKKIAFAFDCESAADIRLHNLAATVYTKNTKSGGIHKIDNSFGEKVDIMICDMKSYTVAMFYMLSFNKEENIILFYDEPTITMDTFDEHPLHHFINKNWKENVISKVILSCATLPAENEIEPVINDFKLRFNNSKIITINSVDFKKTISIIDKDGFSILPHNLFVQNYRDLVMCARHCIENKILLRYLDLSGIVAFIKELEDRGIIEPPDIDIKNLSLYSVTMFYLNTLLNIDYDKISKPLNTELNINSFFNKKVKYNGCIYLTTHDAYTLTDGPTIYMVEDVIKISSFMRQQANIPEKIIKRITESIEQNNLIQKQKKEIEKKIEDKNNSGATNTGDGGNNSRETFSKEVMEMQEQINALDEQKISISLDNIYIPNTRQHQEHIHGGIISTESFISTVEESIIKEIMEMGDLITNNLKLLLMMGIGVFFEDAPSEYLEIIKELSHKQHLYLIIASSDYIYGTNYQFCHGFLGKDLAGMTQQKIIQAMGRVGRGNIQQTYTVRFRNNEILKQLFMPLENNGMNIEALVMNNLFLS